jgi:hypothetical protein
MLPWLQGRTAAAALSMHGLCPRRPRHEFISHVAFTSRRSRPAPARRASGTRSDRGLAEQADPHHRAVRAGRLGDITARLVGKYIEDKTGQPFVVENKPGANGIVGVLAVKSAPADGYTLMLATTSTNAANIHMFRSPGYDPETVHDAHGGLVAEL